MDMQEMTVLAEVLGRVDALLEPPRLSQEFCGSAIARIKAGAALWERRTEYQGEGLEYIERPKAGWPRPDCWRGWLRPVYSKCGRERVGPRESS